MAEEYVFNENELELVALRWLEEVGYTSVSAKELEDSGMSKRNDYKEVVLKDRLQEALITINPNISIEVIDEALKKITVPEHPNMEVNNQTFHKYITDGIEIQTRENNTNVTKRILLFDFNEPRNNDFLAVNQFIVEENNQRKRTDIILFINGLPLVLFELKNATDEAVGTSDAYNQLQTYKQEIPSLLTFNEFMVASDGVHAKVGTLSSNEERFMVWRTIDGQIEYGTASSQLEVLIKGMCNPEVLLDLIHHFILFKTDGDKTIKILAAYHQYHAVNSAVEEAKRAVSSEGDNKIGVIWHTQGSGKSLSMVFYTGKLVQELNNPTIVVLTDRNDLDDQLFLTFSQSSDLLRQTPKQANNRNDLRELLSVNAGGVIFSTMQKFSPESGNQMDVLTDRRNVIVMADEDHRSQYGFSADIKESDGTIKYGYAKYLRDALPNASYIGFTGTPISSTDKSTKAVFGDYIDVYDMTQSVEDGATVKIYYESRIIPVSLPEDLEIDDLVEEIVEGQEDTIASKSKVKWSRVEAITGAQPRLEQLAKDFVTHFETRQEASFGKSMIVAMSRRIAIDLYQEIIKLRPKWHSDDDDKGKIKIVMTGSSSDPDYWQPFIGNKSRRDKLATRMKDDSDELQIVIVRDMWLTGFDVPSMNTMYIDKPMQGHNLMQAIARVNRVFKDKTGGLVVDYIGIAPKLKSALQEYTPSDQAQAGIDTKIAVNLVKEKYDLITNTIIDKFDYLEFNSSDHVKKLTVITNAANYILGLDDKEEVKRFKDLVTEITRAYALCVTEEEVQQYNAEIAFFKAVKVYLIKLNFVDGVKSPQQIDEELKQLISKSVVTEDIVDIYESLGLEKAELSILSDKFLEEIKEMPQKNLALQLLENLLAGKVKSIQRTNIVQAKKYSDLLQQSIDKYNLRGIDSEIAIRELIELAKEMKNMKEEGEELGLTVEEKAFYDIISKDSEVDKQVLKDISVDIAKTVNDNMTLDWTKRASEKAGMRVEVKRLLRKHQFKASPETIQLVIEQAESMAGNLTE
ncbi:type I restriction endonuclease subunit R [Brochothrix thermosphacta]|uniref:type I restriction endonuclease subunit R n=1 Tax=Brochothrix thermosphacta TaxID=2756 RepID=UPI0003E87AB8|nr:type I restriction endonuclease subunit R [Brochothrix thermosphacta]EUJ35270.1 type I restriction-modification system endonuclease [Brochothrix thermosphacta DSM 20171 = FSL F6-1036]ODJ49512.1 DEAD/DEAH box helicase [Brochothrix thermosphacta DSM 20171 = FSL F6-1036]